jgi:hypothetical protein
MTDLAWSAASAIPAAIIVPAGNSPIGRGSSYIDRADAVQCSDRAIRIERHIRHVRRRIGKMRRVGHVEALLSKRYEDLPSRDASSGQNDGQSCVDYESWLPYPFPA